MDNKTGDLFNEVKYANLSDKQQNELGKMERKFNEEFGSSFYFLVFDRPTHSNPS